MDFLKELFGDKAITFDELVKAVEEHNKANKDNQINAVNLASGGYVSKDKYQAKEKELEKANGQIKTLNTAVKNHEGDIQKLNDDLKQKQKDYDSEIKGLRDSYAIDGAVSNFFKDHPLKDSKYEQLLKSQINRDLLKVDGESVTGLSEQTKLILEQYSDLFGNPVPKGKEPSSPETTIIGNLDSFAAIEKNANKMTAEQVAEAFTNLKD